ncbi:hypothetical protein ACFUJ0_03945 [Streptomyces sp. NPDC057242]
MRFAASAVFVAVFVPISLYRRLRGSSRFGPRFHRGPSAWDLPRAVRPR